VPSSLLQGYSTSWLGDHTQVTKVGNMPIFSQVSSLLLRSVHMPSSMAWLKHELQPTWC